MAAAISLDRLADEFIATMREHGMTIDRSTVRQEMRERTAAIAERLKITSQAVLQQHAQAGWGHQMAVAVIAHIQQEQLLTE